MEDASSATVLAPRPTPRYVLEPDWPHRAVPTATLAGSAALLSGCGGGSGGSASGTPTPTPPPDPETLTEQRAAHFLAQASMGATREQIARVQALGYAGWIDEQFAMAPSGTRWDALVAGGFAAATYKNSEAGIDAALPQPAAASQPVGADGRIPDLPE